MPRRLAFVICIAFAWSCTADPEGRVGDDPNDLVRAESLLVPGFVPAANPSTDEETPSELNQARVVRYFSDREVAPRAIVVAMPGFLGGGPSFDGIARTLVRNGAAEGFPVEVWAIDRRSNGLEDLTGMNAAERDGDAEIAWAYYFDGAEADGRTFDGYVPQEDVSFMSEWGLETHIEDLRAVIDLVPDDQQRGHVFLAGHSFGATVVELYAAWRFASDGRRGFDQIAGMIFLDGLMRDAPSEQAEFESELAMIRASERYTTLPLLGIDVYTSAEIVSLRTWFDPSGIVEDPVRDGTFEILFGLAPGDMPAATNVATLGLAFDSMHQPLSFSRTTLGTLTGGPTEDFTFALAGDEVLQRPSDPDAIYDWVDAFDSDPQELTPARNLARSFTIGESNFAEWYFPERISLDAGAARGGNLDEDGWQAQYGIRAFDGDLNDAPALCILARNADRCEALRTRLAPALGEGRPQAGAGRDTDLGVTAIEATGMAHLDLILSDDRAAENEVPDAIANFLGTHTAEGAVTLPDL